LLLRLSCGQELRRSGSLLIPRSVLCSWLSSYQVVLYGKSSQIPTPSRRGSIPDDSDPEASDLADAFLDDATEWGEASQVISDSVRSIRQAEREFAEWLDRLAQRGLVVYGGRRLLMLQGGVGPTSYWWEAMLQVVRVSDLPLRTQQLDG
jgi:hypothetical protein